SLSLSGHRPPPHLPSFPTRRSSDLTTCSPTANRCPTPKTRRSWLPRRSRDSPRVGPPAPRRPPASRTRPRQRSWRHTIGCTRRRSEEHTSELQSLRHLVCRLLLEKK